MARIAIDARKIQDFGIGTYLQNLLIGIERSDNQDEFIIFLPPKGTTPVSSPRFKTIRVTAKNYGISEHFSLPWLARRNGAELYHSPHYVLPLTAPKRSVVTVHDLIHLRFPEYLPNRAAHIYAKTILRRAYQRAARVLTVSEASKNDMLTQFGGDPNRIVVIPNSVPEVYLRDRSDAEIERVRRRWGLHGRFLLYTGNVKPHKNLDNLLRAFARVHSTPDGADVKLILMGNHLSRYRSLRRLGAELQILDHVRLLGWLPQEELSIVYRLAAVFAYPSLYEGFGLPPLEAMASGVPVVASNTSSLPEVCGDAALLVDPRDVESIAAGILKLLTDETLAKELRRRGRERAKGFSADKQASRTLEVYQEVLST